MSAMHEMYRQPLEQLDRAVGNAALRVANEHPAWNQAETYLKPIDGSGTDAQLVTRAGLYAAHLVRLHYAGRDEMPPWAGVLEDQREHLGSRSWDRRMLITTELRRAITFERPGDPSVDVARHIAKMYSEHAGSALEVATAHLARYLFTDARRWVMDQELLEAAWYCVHGPDLIDVLVELDPTLGATGRPTEDAVRARQALRTACRGMHATGLVEKKTLAAWVGISRPTLDAWLASR